MARSSSRPTAAPSPQPRRWWRPIRRSSTHSRFTPKWRPIAPMRWRFSIKRGAIPDALYWDTLDPYHYVRLQPGEGRNRLRHCRRRRPQERRSRRCRLAFRSAGGVGAKSHSGLEGRDPSLVGTSARYHRLCRVHRPQSGKSKHLRPYRRLRPGNDSRRGGKPDQFRLDPRRQSEVAGGLRTHPQDALGDRQFFARKR